MSDLQELTNELMQDPEFKKEYDALQPEMDITRPILDVKNIVIYIKKYQN